MKYLSSQSFQLEYNIKIHYPLSGLDKIYIAHCKGDKSAFIIQNLWDITIYVFHTTPYGELSFTATEETFDSSCDLIANSSADHDCSTCSYCINHEFIDFEGMVDKGYKVFYQTWKDLFKFRNRLGSALSISLQHRQIQPSWDASNIIDPEVDITRYGLRWTVDDANIFKALWETAAAEENAQELVRAYNPWV
ncbi:hypothetical protein HDV01_007205 [Terramyces sp. JEL0728]|nr:hypothetical protein HDV01_007205 [Terramyces sp. JEL0728]